MGSVIERLLRRLYQQPALDRLDLFRYYSYEPRYAEATLRRVAALGEMDGARVRVPGLDGALPSPDRFYRLLQQGADHETEEVACCTVHGDLNLANVLLDDAGNTWLIDYFWTRLGHALDDVAKLENDLKFIMTPLADDAALARAFAFERWLIEQDDLLAPRRAPESTLADSNLARTCAAVESLRELAASLLRDAGLAGPVPARQYRIAQLRYSAHTLSFEECDLRQKRLALASTCLLADRLAGAP
jgi:hypothetical protein